MIHPLDRLRAALKGGYTSALRTPEQIEELLEDLVWIGDLSGMEVVVRPHSNGTVGLYITHRCGRPMTLLDQFDGMSHDNAALLGNLVVTAVEAREMHACPPHNPSPEHEARMQRWGEHRPEDPFPTAQGPLWQDTASGAPRPVPRIPALPPGVPHLAGPVAAGATQYAVTSALVAQAVAEGKDPRRTLLPHRHDVRVEGVMYREDTDLQPRIYLLDEGWRP